MSTRQIFVMAYRLNRIVGQSPVRAFFNAIREAGRPAPF